MEAPNKIYVRDICGSLIASRTPKVIFGEPYPEYIRKDALLDWAKENRDSLGRLSYGEFIDKINSL